MTVIVDTREKNLHIVNKLEQMGIECVRKKLNFGDYSFELDGKSYSDKVVIERKGSIDEIIGNFTKGRDRFRREFERSHSCHVTLMIEASEYDINKKKYRSRMSPSQVKSFIKTWAYKFGLTVAFVKKEDAAQFVLDVFEKYKGSEET